MSSPLAMRAARKSVGVGNASGSTSMPITPRRPRFMHTITPENSPSLSASKPFDWEGVRGRKPPVYSTPLRVKQLRTGQNPAPVTSRRVFRKKTLKERLKAIPSDILFHILVFPENIPLPEPKVRAKIIGGIMHFLHFCVRISSSKKAIEDMAPWDDYSGDGKSWFDWTLPVSLLLLIGSFYTALRLFATFKSYSLYLQTDPVASPRASFVSTRLDRESLDGPSFKSQMMKWIVDSWSVSWRFFFNLKPLHGKLEPSLNSDRVQQLNVWNPGEFELQLFAIYSPVHALLWMATNFSNWILMLIIMGVVGTQTSLLTSSYSGLIKDKTIIAGEVLHEYNEKFVHPRIFPLRFDKAVMTNEAEMVNCWE